VTDSLQGIKVLVVEDEYLVASLIEEMLQLAGCVVCGPVPRLAQAVDAANNEACDVAVLDINLAGQWSYPVAEVLARRNVPFVFVTGYGANAMPAEFAGRPRLHKPFKLNELLTALSSMVSASSGN
jgi:DNA-binding response OmpR family regulator